MAYTNHRTGYRQTDTSAAAAIDTESSGRSATLRLQVLTALTGAGEPKSADELATMLGENIANIRPRLTELRATGKVADSGKRGKTAYGKSCIKWQVPQQ